MWTVKELSPAPATDLFLSSTVPFSTTWERRIRVDVFVLDLLPDKIPNFVPPRLERRSEHIPSIMGTQSLLFSSARKHIRFAQKYL